MKLFQADNAGEFETASTVIVVPCFNEATRLQPGEFLKFVDQHPGVQILFVNDGSTDQTAEILQDLCRLKPFRFRVLDLAQNCGKSEAVRKGMLSALEFSPAYVGYWDADLATPLNEIPSFQRILDHAPDVNAVLGIRLPLLGRKVARNPWRAGLGRCFAAAASVTLGFHIRDTQCGAKLFRASEPLTQALQNPFSSRWIFDVELLARLAVLSGSDPRSLMFEHPLLAWSEVAGSKLQWHHFLRATAELASIFWRYTGSRRTSFVAAVQSANRGLPEASPRTSTATQSKAA